MSAPTTDETTPLFMLQCNVSGISALLNIQYPALPWFLLEIRGVSSESNLALASMWVYVSLCEGICAYVLTGRPEKSIEYPVQ